MNVFSPTTILCKEFVDKLIKGYKTSYGGLNPSYCEIIAWAGNIALELIGNTNCLYHNVEHTILVTLVGQEILRGKHIMEGGVKSINWLNTIVSLLFHDIGYIRGVCKKDNMEKRLFSTGKNKNEVVQLSEEATDAALTPYHVDRGKLFIQERFGNHQILNVQQIKKNIELTRFPVSKEKMDELTDGTFDWPVLVSAADLIGQLADIKYTLKAPALFYEFEEIGANKKFGYKSPNDIVRSYSKFFWSTVYDHIQPSLKYLKVTDAGKSILSSLYSNVFSVENHSILSKTNVVTDVPLRIISPRKKDQKTPKKLLTSTLGEDEREKKERIKKMKVKKSEQVKTKFDNFFSHK